MPNQAYSLALYQFHNLSIFPCLLFYTFFASNHGLAYIKNDLVYLLKLKLISLTHYMWITFFYA